MEQAAEEGDVSAFKAVVSESYEDERGFDKRDLAAYVTFHVMRDTHRRVFTRVRSVEIRESGRAEVVLVAAIRGRTDQHSRSWPACTPTSTRSTWISTTRATEIGAGLGAVEEDSADRPPLARIRFARVTGRTTPISRSSAMDSTLPV